MKINRTYSIDHWIAVELQKKPNQSRFVNDAIKTKLDGSQRNSIKSASAEVLMWHLEEHKDCPAFVKRAIQTQSRAITSRKPV